MNVLRYISILLPAVILFSCGNESTAETTQEGITDTLVQDFQPAGEHYINEYGEVYLFPVDDSTYKTTWINKEGFTFDTLMPIAADSVLSLMRPWKDHILLKYHWGGIIIQGDELWVLEFSSFARLATETKIPELYHRKFFRDDKKIEIEGRLTYANNHGSLNGIYFEPNPNLSDMYYMASGNIRREPYPEIFWSTNNSPEGIEGVDENSFRLVFTNYTLVEPKKSIYSGTAVNNSEGDPCIAWDFADSEAYILENRQAWMADEPGMKIFVEGYLTQDAAEGSVLRNWTMDLSKEVREINGFKTNLDGNGGLTPKDQLIIGYKLEGHGTWPEDEVNQPITVLGRLTTEGEWIVMKEYEFVK